MSRSDRPLSRKLVRLGFQFLGRSRAHWQDTWPGLLLDIQTGRATWRGRELLTLSKCSDLIPTGMDTIAVVGSGPSLRGQNIDALGDDRAILCNGAASLAGQLRPLAIAVEDERFVFRHHEMLSGLPAQIPALLSPAALRAWAGYDPASLMRRKVALLVNLTKPLSKPRRAISDASLRDVTIRHQKAALSLRPDQGVVITGTVAFSALQVALAAQPDRILLAGIDLSNDNEPRFYESTDRAASGLSSGLDRILEGFALANQVATRRGCTLACASPVSALLSLGIPLDRSLM